MAPAARNRVENYRPTPCRRHIAHNTTEREPTSTGLEAAGEPHRL
jgi:hypothetical protein